MSSCVYYEQKLGRSCESSALDLLLRVGGKGAAAPFKLDASPCTPLLEGNLRRVDASQC